MLKNSGIVIVNKPSGITSFKVIEEVRKHFGTKKIGHTGTLDPFATGVLPLCLNRATRLAKFFTNCRKGYSGKIKLGIETDSYDLTGKVITEKEVPKLNHKDIDRIFNTFVGEIEMLPPMFSAKKIKGKKLYEHARKGIEIERSPVKSTIYNISFSIEANNKISFQIECTAGTYIRSFAHEVGKIIGCGAHLSSLKRTLNGPFTIEKAVELEQILDKAPEEYVIPMNSLPLDMEKLIVSEKEESSILCGNSFPANIKSEIPDTEQSIRLINNKGELLAIGEVITKSGNLYVQPRLVLAISSRG